MMKLPEQVQEQARKANKLLYESRGFKPCPKCGSYNLRIDIDKTAVICDVCGTASSYPSTKDLQEFTKSLWNRTVYEKPEVEDDGSLTSDDIEYGKPHELLNRIAALEKKLSTFEKIGLYPCPFCQSPRIKIIESDDGDANNKKSLFEAVCKNCGARSNKVLSVDEAAENWNERKKHPIYVIDNAQARNMFRELREIVDAMDTP